MPDNPSSANQSQGADKGNLSEEKCDTVTLDRSVPTPPPGSDPIPPAGDPAPPAGDPAPPAGDPASPVEAGGLKIGSLSLVVPKRVKIGKVRQLVVGANASQAGQLTLRLMRGTKVISRLSVGLSAGQTKQRLRLPKRLKAGTYTVTIAFKASGAGWAATGSTKVSARR